MHPKITPEHLGRGAVVYVRQSTIGQVAEHTESQRRQYALADSAHAYGFAAVTVIDDDLGRSGSGLVERPGFQKLVASVCSGSVGAVFCIEASRLARNGRDWHHLIDLCALVGTLVIDPDGTYDPRLVNDRLLLGLKGTMSEYELNLLRQRGLAARDSKALRGELPTAYTRAFTGRTARGIRNAFLDRYSAEAPAAGPRRIEPGARPPDTEAPHSRSLAPRSSPLLGRWYGRRPALGLTTSGGPAIPDNSAPDGFLVIRDLSQTPAQPKSEDIAKIQRIYWVGDEPQSVRTLFAALGLPGGLRIFDELGKFGLCHLQLFGMRIDPRGQRGKFLRGPPAFEFGAVFAFAV